MCTQLNITRKILFCIYCVNMKVALYQVIFLVKANEQKSLKNSHHELNFLNLFWDLIFLVIILSLFLSLSAVIFAMSGMINRFDLQRVRTISLPEQFMIVRFSFFKL